MNGTLAISADSFLPIDIFYRKKKIVWLLNILIYFQIKWSQDFDNLNPRFIDYRNALEIEANYFVLYP